MMDNLEERLGDVKDASSSKCIYLSKIRGFTTWNHDLFDNTSCSVSP